MKKRILSILLTLAMVLALLPTTASAAELPDWYFLFAVFKNLDADVKDGNGKTTHQKYTMPQEEIDLNRDIAVEFEEYMNLVGVVRAHVEVVVIDTPITELYNDYGGGSYLDAGRAASLLESKVNLDQYDHVTCIVDLNVSTGYAGVSPSSIFENGTGISCNNHRNWESFQANYDRQTGQNLWHVQLYSHEFIHFMERLSRKWGVNFDGHGIGDNFYAPTQDEWKTCHTDIFLNRAKGNTETGTGVAPAAWRYPPHILRTTNELAVPSSVASIGDRAFWGVTDHLARVFIPASVTSIGYAAFWNTGIKDVYYSGTEAQWKAIQLGEYNAPLTNATIHFNSLMADVQTSDYFAEPVAWALEKGITGGTGNGRFSPRTNCTQAQILTFLWRANGSPDPAGTVSGGKYYASAVQWAKEQGVIDGTLTPDSPCTRADAVTYLWRLAGSPSANPSSFTDVSASASYAPAVAWAVEKGVTGGTSATTFSPNDTCTRGQIVTFLYRALA